LKLSPSVGCANIQNTMDVPSVSTSVSYYVYSELRESERTMTYGRDLNRNQPVATNGVGDSELTTNDNQSSTMYENTASTYQENITRTARKTV
jgi:hypothetical protein